MTTQNNPRQAAGSVRTFRGRTLEEILPQIRAELGPDAIVLREREGLVGGVGGFFAQRFVEVDARRGGGQSIDIYDDAPERDLRIDPVALAEQPAIAAPKALLPPEPVELGPRGQVAGEEPVDLTVRRGAAVPEPEPAPRARPFVPPSVQRPVPAAPESAAPARPTSSPRRFETEVFMQRLHEASADVDQEPPAPAKPPRKLEVERPKRRTPRAKPAPRPQPRSRVQPAPRRTPKSGKGWAAEVTAMEAAPEPQVTPAKPSGKPVARQVPKPVTMPAPAAEPVAAPAPEPVATPAPAERVVAPMPEPVATPAPAEPAVARAPEPVATPVSTPAVVPAPEPVAGPEPAPVVELPAPPQRERARSRPRSLSAGLPTGESGGSTAVANGAAAAHAPVPAPSPVPLQLQRPAHRARIEGGLREVLARLLGGRLRSSVVARPAPPRPIDTVLATELANDLSTRGASREWTSQLISAASAHGTPLAQGGSLREAAEAEVARRIVPAPALPAAGAAVAFIGSGGSGKTRCTAALASAYRYGSSLPVTVVALDNPHGARELRRMLSEDGVPVLSLSGERARVAIEMARDGGFVIVDTPTTTPTDPESVKALGRQLDPLEIDATYVALPATLGPQAARRALASFGPLSPSAVAITHADETDQLAVVMEIAIAHHIPLAYFHSGTDHRTALSAVDAPALAQQLLAS